MSRPDSLGKTIAPLPALLGYTEVIFCLLARGSRLRNAMRPCGENDISSAALLGRGSAVGNMLFIFLSCRTLASRSADLCCDLSPACRNYC